MTRLWAEGRFVEVEANEHGQPLSFVWRGRRHRVQHVRQQWRVSIDWWDPRGQAERDYIAVTTSHGLLCVLYLDFENECWVLSKVYD